MTLRRNFYLGLSLLRAHPIAALFVAVAVVSRIVFWLYTGRIWEDALISLSPARNVWEGFGLTHHASEPRVHSFTSALGEIILITGEAFGSGQGLLAMRIASIFAAICAIYYGYRISMRLNMHWSGQVLFLGFLATDHLHIFFGMAGMETQVATALILANAYYFLMGQWRRLGAATGLAIICRPEFLLWLAIVFTWLTIEPLIHRRSSTWRQGLHRLLAFLIPAAALSVPWIIFATKYYGSPVPHTVTVKSSTSGFFHPDWTRVIDYLQNSWKSLAPFKEFWALSAAPLPDPMLKLIVSAVLILAGIGAAWFVRLQFRMLAVFALLVGFIAYRTVGTINPYFMWYLPPFTALLFLFAGGGVSWIALREKTIASILGCGLFGFYAMHLPFTLPLDKRVQEDIEVAVRSQVGKILDALMQSEDSAVLEPLGFIGWEAKNKTLLDFPGLSSPRAFAAYKKHHHLTGLIIENSPRFLVLRPGEWREFVTRDPDRAAQYQVVTTVKAKPELSLAVPGVSYSLIDVDFTIYQKAAAR